MTAANPIHEDSRFSVPTHVLSRRAAGETVLMSLDSELYFGLGGVGDRLWQLIEARASFRDTIDALGAEYEVDRATLEADVTKVLRDLEANGLVAIDVA